MRKIRRFSVNEKGFKLSPDEMRQISGGDNQVRCGNFPCTAEVKFEDGTFETYHGTCSKGTSNGVVYCYCATDGGPFVSTKPGATNECEL